jgi:REP element-mobilizing transposase RayT
MRMFGKIENGRMILSGIGKIAGEYWAAIPLRFQNVVLDEWVVMPDHIHGIIIIKIKENLGWEQNLGEKESSGIDSSGNSSGNSSGKESSGIDSSGNSSGNSSGKESSGIDSSGNSSGNVPRHVPTTDIQFQDIQSNEISLSDIHSPRVLSSGIHPLIKNSLSSIINHYKGDVKKWCNRNGFPHFKWQSRFNDRIIRNDLEFFRIQQYIKDNPQNWKRR